VGGRLSIIGAVYGALIVNYAKTTFSESFPELWLFAMGGLFIAVVMAFPNGLAGLYNTYVAPKVDALLAKKSNPNVPPPVVPPSVTPTTKPAGATKTDARANTTAMPEGVIHE
jgi:urea transport system permease protein